ncbi:hypothetical protein ACPC54_34650 [Kitasatospora sp. NPDC094028]
MTRRSRLWIAEDSADDDAFPLTPAQRDQLIVAAEHDGFASC